VVLLDGPIPEAEGAVEPVRVEPRHAAYAIFTSGSTGRPKGAVNSHRGIVNRLLWIQRAHGLTPEDRVLQKTPYSFDVSVWELFWPLIAGARLVMARPGGHQDPAYLLDTIEREGITVLHFVPSMLQVFLEQEGLERCATLRRVIASGEALPAELADRFFARVGAPGVELHNLYGPTEAAVEVTWHTCEPGEGRVPIGRPVANTRIHLLDAGLREMPAGVAGELCIGGVQVARGYLKRPDLTADRFVPDPFGGLFGLEGGSRLYRTGDLARFLPDGEVEYLGRLDHQVKIRGVRIEPGEIQAVLDRHPRVRESRIVVQDGPRLVAYHLGEASAAELREHLRAHLPEPMVPSAFVQVEAWPLTPNGKLDLKALPSPDARKEAPARFEEPRSETERAIARAWQEVLGVERIGSTDNFFDLGGHSLLMPRLLSQLREILGERGRELRLVDLFRFPTVSALAGFLVGTKPEPSLDRALARRLDHRDRRIAIVGMSGRFPGAEDLERFWENLAGGVESIRRLSDEELNGAALAKDSRHVPAVSMPDGYDRFDAQFFGLSHREAEILDPQQRLFLEVAWEALEDAGHDPSARSVGVFAGTALSTYLLHHLAHDEEVRTSVDPLQVLIGNAPDSLATRVSYKLNLKGPSYSVQSACSTGLVAVHHACQSLLAGECDVAVAGASSLPLGTRLGYLYQEGSIASPDGHCRAFDAGAGGTVFGGGVGAVVLKRLADAQAAGDTIRAVVLGTAVNNDGSDKVGYTAPSVTGQAEVISEALAVAGIEPATISYVEAHGTGTPVGDPIEIAALTQVISTPCALGSVKTNVGHLDTAAGVAGLIKTVLSLEHGQIPPSLHFREPNPQIHFGGGLYVNAALAPWKANGTPRRAGVSSFGIGGTNAHVVLEEAPQLVGASPSARKRHLLVLSARSEEALDAATERLVPHLERHDLADIAWTLGTGRQAFPERRIVVCRDAVGWSRGETGRAEPGTRSVAFLFSGQGSQYPGMGRGLYEEEPVFRRWTDRASEILRIDLLSEERLLQTEIAQPALFAFEYALAQQWMAWGVTPAALLGHSIGEYVAACLATVFSFEDALRLVALRGKLMQEMPPGAMLAVALPEEELVLGADLSIAAVNEPGRSVVAGPFEAVKELERRLTEDGVGCRRLHTSHAFHSPMMEPVRERFAAEVAKVRPAAPRLPFISNVTGTWITPEQATDPAYWSLHLRAPVRFADGVAELLREEGRVLLEVGPGNALTTLARRQTERVVASTRHPRETAEDGEVLLGALGRLWLAGVPIDWSRLYPGERRRRVPLPTYPFERQKYWIESGIEGNGHPSQPARRAAGSIAEELRSLSERLEDDPIAAAKRLQELAQALIASREAPHPRPATRARHARPRLQTAFVAPRDPAEREIAALWQDLLGVDEIGIDDDFFALGGHSLLGTQLLSRLNRAFEVKLPLDALFDAPTVAGLAVRLREEKPRPSAPLLAPTGAKTAPLSFAQERLWFLDRLQPGSSAYNIPAVLRLTGDLDLGALRRSFIEVVRRHGALRTVFVDGADGPMQVVKPPSPVPLPVMDLSNLPDQETTLRIAQEVGRPFDLAHGPVFRLLLLRHGDRDHTLIANIHHIASDGWSIGLLVREVTALYEAFLQGLASPLPELPVQYADFAVWQRSWLSGPALDEQLDYWRRELAGAPPLLQLPADRPRPAVESYRGATLAFPLADEAAAAVHSLARKAGATRFMVLLAAFQTLLHRWSGSEDLLVGSPVANRNRMEIEGLIGLFVNILVFRLRLSGEESFLAILERVRATTVAGQEHQDLPFELLVQDLGVERSLAHNPLFQVMLALLNPPDGELRASGLALAPAEWPSTTAKFDLTLSLVEAGDGFAGSVEYATDLYDDSTVRRFLAHFEALLAGAAAEPEARVSAVALLGETERRQLLETGTGPRLELAEETVVSLFRRQVQRVPEATAVSQGTERLTYAELDERSDRLAARFEKGNIVGIALERTPEMVVAVLAVLKSGGAWVSVDPSHPRERQAMVLETARPHAVITEAGLEVTDGSARAGDLAYVIFTSGSTGRPKGVQVPQTALVSLLLSMSREPGLTGSDTLLAVTTLTFDIAVLELLLPLVVGARIELASREDAADGLRLRRLLETSGATVLQATPATWRMLLDAGWEGADRLKALCGGEALTPDLAARLLPRVGSLWNMYGPTETTIWSAARRVTEDDVAVGRAIANTRLYVLDRQAEPVPLGVPGELCIAGLGLARSYLDAPDLTAERFVPDPLTEEPGARMYRTGDLARWRGGGRIELLGRIDFQVKLRGFRIEPGEIEAALSAHESVQQAVVGLRGSRLVAWVVADEASADELRGFLNARLPEYMVPSAFMALPTLPLNTNGKVDRRALPEPEAVAQEDYVAPRNPTEEQIAALWSSLLRVERVGAGDNFFDLGGHSLLATQLVSHLRASFGVELPVRQLFETPQLSQLAEVVQAAAPAAPPPPIRPELSAADRQQLLVWNDTSVDFRTEACLHELITEQAARTPETVAVVFEGHQLTYRELDQAAGRLAAYLRSLGVGPEVLVGIAAERSLGLVVGLLAILKAGGAYVPLDPDYPAARLAGMLEDAAVPVLLTQSHLLERLPEHGAWVVLLDGEVPEAGALAPIRREPSRLDPRQAAYAIFTSGSTGRPKGAVNEHRGIVNRLLWMQQEYRLSSEDRVLQKTPFSFDVSVWELFWPLITGARLIVARPGGHQDPAYLVDTIEREGITTLHFVPSMLQVFLEEKGLERLSCLRRVIASGEALPAPLADRFFSRLGTLGVKLHNLYGPTEAAVDVTFHSCRRGEPRVPIGRPIANTRIHLVDAGWHEVPVGASGELCIGGVQVGRGYLGRPDLTADRFVPDPFGDFFDQSGSRLYRTGDLARFLPDGEIEYLGRLDHQVKIRGVRMELGEIEEALARHPSVREAVVVVQGEGVDRYLTAFVVPPIPEGFAGLREHLRGRLPEAMVPAAYVFLETMPLSPNGKADRKVLSRIEPERVAGPWTAPRTSTEERLAAIWAGLLGVEHVGENDSFFDLGGHSLMGTRVVSRVREAFGVELPLNALFEAPTVAAFAARIDAARFEAGSPEVVVEEAPLLPGVIEAPLSFAQERLWFLDRLQPGSSAYNITAVLRLTGRLDVRALRRSFDEIVRRHGPLRTTFTEVQGEPRQRVSPATPISLPVVDLSGLPERRRKEETDRRTAAEVARPFDLIRGPLLRIHLLRQGPGNHTLVVVVHHIVSDGWSMGVLVQETTVLYESFLSGLPSPLPELPIQYAEFAAWQRDWLTGPLLEEHLGYWRRELAQAPALVEVPTDRPRPAVQSYRGDVITLDLPATVMGSVRKLARRGGATPFMVLLATFQALLHRESGSNDVLVGSPIANRNRVEVEGLIGLFVNTLVFRLRYRGEESFLDVLDRVRAASLGAYAHQDLPFEVLVDALAIPRSLAHNPLFQVMLVLQNAPPGELRAPGLTLGLLEVANRTAKVDLTLTLDGTAEGLVGTLEYATDLYDEATVRRLLVHFENLLAGVVEDPHRSLSGLNLLSENERRQLLLWNDTAVEYPDACLQELLAAQAERTPDAVAVVFEGERLTYAGLHREAGRLAAHLRSLGVGPEVLVGIAAERSLEMIVGLLGILQAGGAYVPIDPGYPAERLAGMIEDAGVPVLLTQSHLLDRLPEHGAWVVLLDQEIPATVPPAEPVQVKPGHAAYAIFTSGSTGRPKGAVNSHRGIVNRLLWMQQEYGLTPHDRVLQKTPFSFDVSVWEFFWPLITGARLIIARPDGHQDPAYLVDTIVREGITTLHFVPSMLQVFAEQDGLERCANLRRVMASGEALPADLASRFLSRLGGVELHNLYGPTEAAVDVTYHACRPGEARVPIGRPVANTRIHLLDSSGQEVPVGVAGELCIGGVQVGRGYLNRPDLTADRFTPDPFGEVFGLRGARFYRTGDLARWLTNGEVEYLGRIDHQVKIRGVRIELGEIESTLCRHPEVREAVVLTHGQGADRALVAYLVPPLPEGAAGLREHLQASLPEAMVPSAFVFLRSMPLSPNGKVDRKALARIEPERETAAFVMPRTLLEERLVGIWSELLGAERVGAEDHFFHLGGHSLMAMRLVSRVRETFGVELPLREVFEAPTLAGLAARIGAVGVFGSFQEVQDAPLSAGATKAPLSFSQERIWFLDRLQPGAAVYNIPFAMQLRGALQPEALAATFREIARRHEALRTGFEEAEGRPVQVISGEAELEMPLIDLSGLPEPARQPELERLAHEEAGRPFDLRRPPLLRVRTIRLSAAEHALLATIHHIVSDGWSSGVLVNEVAALYAAFAEGRPSPLPDLPLQYADFAVWQRGWLAGEVLEQELAHWRGALAGASMVLDLPADHPRLPVQRHHGRILPISRPAALAEPVRALALSEGATFFMALLGGFATLLHRYSGQEDFLVGTPVAGRNRKEVEPLIGCFVNTLALRTYFDGRPSLRELLGRLRSVTLDAYAHQDLPFERLVEELHAERDLSRSPLFQVMFVLQNAPQGAMELPGITLEPIRVSSGAARFDLTLALVEGDGDLEGVLEYDADLFEETTAHRLATHLQALLSAASAEPEARVSELAFLGEAERRQLLEAGDGLRLELPALSEDNTVISLFQRQVRRAPEAPAVTQGAEHLTYAELDKRSDRLAARLRSQGVGPESLVGIALERTPGMVVAVLAVLKSGGAYVPLDPSHPRERLALILEAARPRVVLTEIGELPEAGIQPVAGDLAYVIFTSGSTGRPKGVQVTQRALVSFLLSMSREPGLCESDVMLAVTTLSFDIAGLELLLPLIVGARVEIASREDAADGLRLRRLLPEATVLQATPATWRMLLDAGWEGDRRLKALCGGEALPADLAVRLLPRVDSLWNMYGPTETTIWSATRQVTGNDVAVGGAIANTRLYVLDRGAGLAPLGVPGELCIGGGGLARGYLDAPHLTAERFVPDPFADEPGARMYRTGDLVRWREEGRIEFLGRIDFRVKLRGFRIELGEIEAALCTHDRVRQAVAGLRDDGGSPRLVAWLVADEGSSDELRAFLRARLPEYMIPSTFMVLPALPLNPNGKVDRKALPEPEAEARAEYVAPRNATEELLAAIWSEVLGIEGVEREERVERVGAEDSFFELGGHSLLGTQVVSRVREELRVELPLRAVFESPTLSALARRVEDLRRKGPAGGPPRIEPLSRERPREGALAVSFSQQRLWFLDRLEPGRATYNIPLALRLEGPLDTGALEAALHEIVRRHEALRTTFTAVDGRPYQLVHEPGPAGLPLCDLSGLEPEERAVESRLRVAEEARTPFSLERGPLVHTTLLRLGDAEHVLLLTLHHIVSDGWSVPIYLREMTSLYEQNTTGKPAMLPELPVQYADFAHWQRRWLQGETLEAELAHWRERLQGLPPLLELPTDRPRPAVRSWRGATRRLIFEGGLARSLHSTARRLGATPFMVMLSAFAALLHRYSSQESFAVGVPVAGRNRVEIEPLIGFFVNTLVLRCDVTGETEVRALVERLREQVLDADAHQDVPFEKLVEELSPGRSLSHSPLFQVMLAFQNLAREDFEPRELKVTPIDAANGTSKFDLTLSVLADEDRMVFALEHSTELFDGATLDRLGGHLVRLLEGALAAPELQVADLPLLSLEEERQLVQWNETAVAHPTDVCLHELVEAQVKRSPERQAVTFEGRSLTYRELDRAADRLALRLRNAGTRSETVVGVLAERSLEMVVALLAVLKAGGAYLPLDPDYPADRLAFMIADSRVPVVLAQESLLEALPVREARVLPLAGAAEAAEEVQRSGAKGIPESLAYVIYTSGSTGRPKGTMVPHRSILNHMLWMQSTFPLEPSDRVLQKTSFSFDASVWEFLAPLFAGATLVMAPPGAQRDPAALARSIQESGATILQVVPSLLRAMLDGGWLDGCRSLRRVYCGGEELTEDIVADFFRVSEAELHNLYGPTETASETTFWTCERDGRRGSVPIGRPVPNTRLHIVDPRLRPVPVGVPGELLIGGVQVSRGYLARPELTAERFVPDPFSGEPGARLYRTGDRVERRPDGAAEFLGRVDFQIKIRGFRIELGEVESALLAIPGIAEAAVLALGEGADKRLVAYVSGPLRSEEIRASLKARLPSFQVPSGIVVLDALPLSPNGKVDRKALARIEPPAAAERELVAPRTPAEEMLTGVWGELLGLENVGVEDQFFELGGHSLLATRLASRVRELFGVEIPLRDIFETPTPAGLALRIEAARISGGPPAPPLVPGMGEDRFRARLSFAQERLWFLDRLQPGSAFYNVPFALRISGALDPAVFAAALAEIVRRHDALRTTFTDAAGEP
jgi:amino acid adenylation domain-containing protein